MAITNRIDALTGVRALAAFWVVSLHYGEFTALFPVLKHIHWITGRGFYGVDVFFILSGFILSFTYQTAIAEMNWRSWSGFVWFRFARIYPAYLAAVLAAVSVWAVAALLKMPWNRESYQPLQLVYELFMVHTWTFHPNQGWNYPDWSVSAEWFAYLFIFPLTYMVLKYVRKIWMTTFLLAVALAAYAFTPIHAPEVGSWGLLQVALEFTARAMLYPIFTAFGAIGTGFQNLLSLALLALMAGILWLGLDTSPQRLAFLVCVAWMLFLLGCRGGFLVTVLGSGVMVYLGEISYSVYLTHGIDQRILKDIFPVSRFADFPFFQRSAIFAIYIGTIIGGAAVLYHFVEVPARSRLRRLFGSGRKTAPVVEMPEQKQA